jgi:triphosphoribosyl-dephospho-CoA synthetase
MAAWLQGEADTLKGAREHGDTSYSMRVAELDDRLKRDAINPGTSADLTASTLLTCRLAGLQVPATAPRERRSAPAPGPAYGSREEG